MSLNAIRLGLVFDLNERFKGLGSRDLDDLNPLLLALDRFDYITSDEGYSETYVQRRKFLRAVVDIGVSAMGTKSLHAEARDKILSHAKVLWKLKPEELPSDHETGK